LSYGAALSAKLVPTFAEEGVALSAQRIPMAVNLSFLERRDAYNTENNIQKIQQKAITNGPEEGAITEFEIILQ
jgi:hypothetical protein